MEINDNKFVPGLQGPDYLLGNLDREIWTLCPAQEGREKW